MAHAPLDMLKSVRRFGDTFLGAEEEESGWGCRVDPTHFGCNRLGTLEFNALHTSIYIGTATATIALPCQLLTLAQARMTLFLF